MESKPKDQLLDGHEKEKNDQSQKEEEIYTNIFLSTQPKNNSQILAPQTFSGEFLCIQRNSIEPVDIEITFEVPSIKIINSLSHLTMFSIKKDDFVSFSEEERVDIKTKLVTQLNITEDKLQNKKICRLTQIPLIKKVKCNCINCFFCCDCECKKQYKERDVISSFLLLNQSVFENMRISLSAFYPVFLNELQANNRKRKILFFVNPVSGTGNSVRIWNKAKAIFDQTDLAYDVIFTERVKHAYDTVLGLSIDQYDGIVNCSGDGILHEIVNGICHRKDRDIFLNRVVVGALPAGSANAFSKAITDYSGEDNRVETNCYLIVKGKSRKLDLQELELFDLDKKVYSFLSLTYGIIADIDLESEVLRCCGMLRTTLWGVHRWLFLRKYYGCLYTLPKDSQMNLDEIPSIKENLNDNNNFVKENENWRFFISGNIKYIGETIKPLPLAELDDGFNDIVALTESKSGRCDLLTQLTTYSDNGDEMLDENGKIKEGINYYKTKFWRLIPKLNLTDPDDVNVKHHFEQFYSIDGERYPICPVQCKTIPKMLTVYTGKE